MLNSKRLRRLMVLVSLGGCLQVGACSDTNVAGIIAEHTRDTIVDIGAAVLESAANQALGLD